MKNYFIFGLFLSLCLQISAQNLTDSLKAYYPFNGNANDMSGFGNNGINYGATLVPDRYGNPNGAYYFDGVSDFIEFTTTPSIKPSTFPISVAAWIRLLPGSPHSDFFISDYSGGKYYGVLMNTNPGTGFVQITFGDGNGFCTAAYRRTKTGTTAVDDGQWHFVVGVIRGATDMDVYVDCQYDAGTYSGGGGNLAYSADNIGRIGMFGCGTSNYQFHGDIDELRFYHRELSASDVVALYNYPTPVNGNQIVGILGNDTTICPGQNLTLNATMPWATSYLWSNGSSSPTINVNSAGTYSVSVSGGLCGQGGGDTIVVSTGNSSANLFPDTVICKNQTLILDAGADAVSYSWSTGDTTQTITTNVGGTFIVQVQIAGGCTLIDTINVTGLTTNIPYSQFSYNFTPGGGVQINNTSLYSTSYSWLFSNGGADTTKNPQYNFPCNVPITVTLICYGHCGSDTTQTVITNLCNGIDDISQVVGLNVFPQPASTKLNIQYEVPYPQIAHILINNTLGQILYEEKPTYQQGEITKEIDIDKWVSGTYYLQIITNLGIANKKILIEK